MANWVFRQATDIEQNRKMLFGEIEKGRLRQGWGWADSLDIQSPTFVQDYESVADCDVHVAQKVHNKLKDMLAVNEGDLMIIPKQPEYHFFTIVEAKKPKKSGNIYTYEAPPPNSSDFRHVIHVDESNVRTFHYDSGSADSVIKKLLKGLAYSHPIREIKYKEFTDAVSDCWRRTPSPDDRKAQSLREKMDQIQEDTYERWLKAVNNLTNKEFEDLIKEILDNKGYKFVGPNTFNRKGGDIDLRVSKDMNFGDQCPLGVHDLPVNYHIQVKKKHGTDYNDVEGVNQLIGMQCDAATFNILISMVDEFTEACKKLAGVHNVTLINGRELARIALG